MLVSVTGFWNLYFGADAHANGFHHLHVISSFLWLWLIAFQLLMIGRRKHNLHRKVGMAIFFAGPFIVASLALLTVYSASRSAAQGIGDELGVQNVMVTLEIGLIIFLAFLFKRKFKVHGELILASALMFLGIALFFSLLSFVPRYEIAGPETFSNFGDAAIMATYICTGIGILMFLRDFRNGWPWLMVIGFFYLNGFLSGWIRASDNLILLTNFVGGFNVYSAFAAVFLSFSLLLAAFWRRGYQLKGRKSD